jgi:hypothetical protein
MKNKLTIKEKKRIQYLRKLVKHQSNLPDYYVALPVVRANLEDWQDGNCYWPWSNPSDEHPLDIVYWTVGSPVDVKRKWLGTTMKLREDFNINIQCETKKEAEEIADGLSEDMMEEIEKDEDEDIEKEKKMKV